LRLREIGFVGVNARVEALMDMTHVSQLFRMYPTVQEAEAGFLSKPS
jgi:anti-anti-sigma regulatory factor